MEDCVRDHSAGAAAAGFMSYHLLNVFRKLVASAKPTLSAACLRPQWVFSRSSAATAGAILQDFVGQLAVVDGAGDLQRADHQAVDRNRLAPPLGSRARAQAGRDQFDDAGDLAREGIAGRPGMACYFGDQRRCRATPGDR